jgi:hypothetical protein
MAVGMPSVVCVMSVYAWKKMMKIQCSGVWHLGSFAGRSLWKRPTTFLKSQAREDRMGAQAALCVRS